MAEAALNNCIYVVSHGNYPPLSLDITVPNNINLIQYSIPGLPLSKIEANQIIKYRCSKVPNYYLIDKNDGEIYKSEFKRHVTGPGDTTKDLTLNFTPNEMDGFRIGIFTESEQFIPDTHTQSSLKDILINISRRLKQTLGEKIVDVIQLSCRGGSYREFIPNRTEFMRALNACNYDRNIHAKIRDLQLHHYDITTDDYYVTQYVDEAEKLSCLIERNYPLDNFKTVEKLRRTFNLERLDLPPRDAIIIEDSHGDDIQGIDLSIYDSPELDSL